MLDVIKIPNERISILIGTHGETKKWLEKELNVKIDVNSKNGEVVISGEADAVYFASPVIKAIARGFNPKIAVKLKDPDYIFEIIDLRDYYNTENAMIRIKARVIGKKGSIKKDIERMTSSFLSIYGHTIGIIAPYYAMPYAKEVVEKLVKGAKHSTALNYLSKARDEIVFKKLKGTKHV